MSVGFYPKDSNAADRALKVQRLVIPFTITHNATPASVTLTNDEPSVLFIKTEGVDYITAELTAQDDSCTYSQSPDDSDGKVNFLVVVGEEVAKVMRASVTDRVHGGESPTFLGDADGLTANGNIALSMDSSIDFATTDGDLCLVVEYVAADGN